MSTITTITVPFGDLRSVTAPYLYRYDTDVYMQITGVAYLPDTCSVYFANTQSGTATEMIAASGLVAIPNALLTTGLPIYAYFHVTDDTTARTLYKIKIPVKQVARPDGSTTPTQATAIEQAISALNAAQTTCAQNAAAAQESAGDAEAWAVGQRGGTDVGETDETYQNNSKYYSEVAEMAANTAGYFDVVVNSAGHLIYTRTDTIDTDFSIDTSGHLIMEA